METALRISEGPFVLVAGQDVNLGRLGDGNGGALRVIFPARVETEREADPLSKDVSSRHFA
jgi:hypothetical protein